MPCDKDLEMWDSHLIPVNLSRVWDAGVSDSWGQSSDTYAEAEVVSVFGFPRGRPKARLRCNCSYIGMEVISGNPGGGETEGHMHLRAMSSQGPQRQVV